MSPRSIVTQASSGRIIVGVEILFPHHVCIASAIRDGKQFHLDMEANHAVNVIARIISPIAK